MDVECDNPDLPVHQKGYAQMDQLAAIVDDAEPPPDAIDEPDPPDSPLSDTLPLPMETTTQAPHSIESIPDLEVPLPLFIHNLGILTLTSFPSQPKILVCIQCRLPFNALDRQSFEAHKCAESEEGDRKEVAPSESEESHMDVDEEDEDMEKGDEDEPRGPVPRIQVSWVQTHSYLKTRLPEITIARNLYPTVPVPTIPFFPVTRALGCPFPTCPVAYLTRKTLRRHLNADHSTIPASQDPYEPELVPVQSLYSSSRTQYFKVLPLVMEPVRISVRDQVVDTLTALDTSSLEDADAIGPQFIDTFYKTFPYHSVFPTSAEARTTFSKRLLYNLTPVHKQGQTPEQQFLSLICLVYMIDGSKGLYHADNIVQRQFGNKLK